MLDYINSVSFNACTISVIDLGRNMVSTLSVKLRCRINTSGKLPSIDVRGLQWFYLGYKKGTPFNFFIKLTLITLNDWIIWRFTVWIWNCCTPCTIWYWYYEIQNSEVNNV
jgi:hypothetical protein